MLICGMRFGFHFETFELFVQKTTDTTKYIQGNISPNLFGVTVRKILCFSQAFKIVGRHVRFDAAAVCDKEVLRTLITALCGRLCKHNQAIWHINRKELFCLLGLLQQLLWYRRNGSFTNVTHPRRKSYKFYII